MLSRRKALSLATLLLPQLYFAGIGSAQQPTTPAEPPPAEAATPATEAATPSTDEGAPRRGRKAGEEEIIVTGSRIRRKDLTTPAPITVINREAIQASGRVTIGDFLQSLPESLLNSFRAKGRANVIVPGFTEVCELWLKSEVLVEKSGFAEIKGMNHVKGFTCFSRRGV